MKSGNYFLNILRLLGHQEWIRFGIRNRIINFFFSSENESNRTFRVPFFDFIYPGEFQNFIDWNVFFYGAYEKKDLMILKKVIMKVREQKKKVSFLDIGANIGHHSLFAARYCDEVHSFEPIINLVMKLEEKKAINHLNNITIHPVALGETDELRTFHLPIGSNTGTGSFLSMISPTRNVKKTEIKIHRGDKYFVNNNINNVDIIKIDVEGYETNVLQGLRSLILECKPIIFMEYNSFTHNSISKIGLKNILDDSYKMFTWIVVRQKLKFKEYFYNYTDSNIFLLNNHHLGFLSK